jgi:3-phenylpropionate/trans-cinnamate dioxygenase ferredoxin reductase subunit
MSNNSIVIVGAGQAGYQVAASLRRDQARDHPLSATNPASLPRPPLSKAYLAGESRHGSTAISPARVL